MAGLSPIGDEERGLADGPLVRFIGSYDYPLKRMFPNGEGRWGRVRFTTEPVMRPDFIVSLNYPRYDLETECPVQHCWSLTQEPPHRVFHWMHSFHSSFGRLYSSDPSIEGPGKTLTHPHMHWHVKRSLEWLRQAVPQKKTKMLSTITSDMQWLKGHRLRFGFVKTLSEELELDWYGRGVKPLEDKWDGLAPYKYSLTIENFRSNYYWTEKLIDCFLTWTVPLYHGCPRIGEYFPERSLVPIDVSKPEEARRVIREVLDEDDYESRLEALTEARRRILEELNPFAFLAGEIERHLDSNCSCRFGKRTIEGRYYPQTLVQKVRSLGKYKLEQLLKRPVTL